MEDFLSPLNINASSSKNKNDHSYLCIPLTTIGDDELLSYWKKKII